MYCKNCGSEINEKGKYCTNCGRKRENNGRFHKLIKAAGERYNYVRNYLEMKIERTEMNYFKKYGLYLLTAFTVSFVLFAVNITVVPYYKKTQYAKGKAYLEEEAYEEAVQVFSQATGLSATDSEVYKYLGKAYFNLEDYENAMDSLFKSLDLTEEQRDMEIYMLLSEVYLYEGDMSGYEEILVKMTEMFPNHSYAYLKLGNYYMNNKYFDRAQKILEQLLIRENNDEAVKLLYNVYLQSYTENKAAEKVNSIRTSAYKLFSNNITFEFLDTEDETCIAVSPKGNYILRLVSENNKKHIKVYRRDENYYEYLSSLTLPILYVVDGAEISWSEDESKFAFYNKGAEEYSLDSHIYMYDIENKTLHNMTDPKNSLMNYAGQYGVFIIDSIPAFSEDGEIIYFARYSAAGNGLYSVHTETGEIKKLFEPDNGARVMYRIIEKNGSVYFSVSGKENTAEAGIYKLDNNECEKLIFDYDDKFYFPALEDISADGRYLMYYITTASQNNSFYFKILDLKTMKLIDIYDQVIDYVGKEFTSVCRMDIFGERYVFICKNAAFSEDGKSVIIAEEAKGFSGKTLRSINLENGNNTFLYLSFDEDNMAQFSLNNNVGGAGESILMQMGEHYLIYDGGLKIMAD